MSRGDNQRDKTAWLASFPVPGDYIRSIETKLEDALQLYADIPVISLLEERAGNQWRIEILFAVKPDTNDITRLVETVCKEPDLPHPEISWEPVEERDWVSESQKLLPPIEAGSFFVYGSHDKSKLPNDKIGLEIEAGPAFGTGQHETTKGCLLALDQAFQEDVTPKSALDLGCGSGILALAMARLWPDCTIIGSDIDPVSVGTAIENAEKNGAAGIRFIAADGLDHLVFRDAAPFDLIVSNILAGPLCTLAPAVRQVCNQKTRVILSGLMRDQESETLAAYQQQGFRYIQSNYDKEWTILTLQA